MVTQFAKLNEDWNAEPNAPYPKVAIEGGDVLLSFDMNSFQFPQYSEGDRGTLRFSECSRYRLGPTNDEGWRKGQCRFSRLAPQWGEFYEIQGDLMLDELCEPWVTVGPSKTKQRHFLFYLRDETFECDAASWGLTVLRSAQAGANDA